MTQTSKRLTHATRQARRRAMAEAVRVVGGDMRGIASQFKVSHATVCAACIEFGVHVRPNRNQGNFSSYRVIAALFDPTRTFAQIGQGEDISAARVGQVYQACREAGVPVPVRSRRRKS